jgi:hypothetical protein
MNASKSVAKNVSKRVEKVVEPTITPVAEITPKPVVADNLRFMSTYFELASISDFTKSRRVHMKAENRVFLSSATSGAGQMELLMLRKEGATIEEMRKCRGGVESHLNSLKKKGANIEYRKETKTYHFITSFTDAYVK